MFRKELTSFQNNKKQENNSNGKNYFIKVKAGISHKKVEFSDKMNENMAHSSEDFTSS